MGEVNKQDTSRSSTENWRAIVYLGFGRNGIPPSELDILEWDIYFGMLDEFEKENEEFKKASKVKPGAITPPKLQGETEKEKIMSMMKPRIRTVKK